MVLLFSFLFLPLMLFCQAEDDLVLLAAIPLAVLDSTLCWWISYGFSPIAVFVHSFAFLSLSHLLSLSVFVVVALYMGISNISPFSLFLLQLQGFSFS